MADSFVVIDSARVIEMAEACLKHIYDHRERERKKLFDYERNRPRLLRNLFGKPLTDDQIWDTLRHDWAYRGIAMYAWRSEQVAKNLLKAAKMAPQVHVTADDLHFLTGG